MLELEWESTYNKLRSLIARLNKRDERAAGEPEVTPPRPGAAGDGVTRINERSPALRRNY